MAGSRLCQSMLCASVALTWIGGLGAVKKAICWRMENTSGAECRHYGNEEDKQDDESSQHGGRSRLDVGSIRLPTLIGNYVRRLTGHGG